MKNKSDTLIVLAWPEGMVANAGAWYDKFLAKNGKYRVGHSAIILASAKVKKVFYFDFGRYHTPIGYGRVRDADTDPDLSIKTPLKITGSSENIKEILFDISRNRSTHGKGKLYASVLNNINFKKAFKYAKKIQKKGAVPYGPFVFNGTNCSRFVASVIKASDPPLHIKYRLTLPVTISPSPKRNVSITNSNYYIVEKNICKKIIKSRIKSYFTSIERI